MLIKLWTWVCLFFKIIKYFKDLVKRECFNKWWHFANCWFTLNREHFFTESLLNSLLYSSPSPHSKGKICSRVFMCPLHSYFYNINMFICIENCSCVLCIYINVILLQIFHSKSDMYILIHEDLIHIFKLLHNFSSWEYATIDYDPKLDYFRL